MQMIYLGKSGLMARTARGCSDGDQVDLTIKQGDRTGRLGGERAEVMNGMKLGGLRSLIGARFLRATVAALLIGICGTAMTHAQSASTWNKRGQDAEAREDYDAAFEAYRQAHNKKPGDLRYKTHIEGVRTRAAAVHVDRGRTLRQNADFAGALKEFMRALEISPGDQAAQQEIDITQRQESSLTSGEAGQGPSGSGKDSKEEKPIEEIAALGPPVALQLVSNNPITLHMVEDVKVIYQAIGKMAGLNVLFDPDYTSKRISVDLTAVSLADALHIVGTVSGTFWKPVTRNTIFVAQNTRQKRTDLDDLAVQTFYLTNAVKQADANDILTVFRNLFTPTGTGNNVYLVQSQNAIVMRGTPDQLLLAQKLINDLDRARPEVEVDVAILEVNRDKMRNLGITLPQSFGLTPQANTTSSTTNTTGTTTTGTSTTSSLTLNNLAHLNATNFSVSLTGGTLNALLNDSDTKVLQNPRLRATDGQMAKLLIGSKIPEATGSYNAGVSTGVASIGVQTQFTQQDVGVNIVMTPTVHYDHEVSLKMKIEVSTQSGSVTISGVTEPIISLRSIEQVIQLQEGEPSILAGLLDNEDNRSNTGTPGLAEIPILKYFFGSQFKETKQDEIIFLLIPHIVRESVLTRLNTRAIETGSSTEIDLRHEGTDAPAAAPAATPVTGTPHAATMPRANPPVTAADAASAMIQQIQGNSSAAAAAYAVAAAPAPMSSSPPLMLSVVPPNPTQAVGSTFQVAVLLSNAHDVSSVPLQVQFNPQVLSLVNVDSGEMLSRDGQAVAMTHSEKGSGLVAINAARPPNATGVNGQGTVCMLTFKANAAGDSNIALVKVGATDSSQGSLPAVGSQAMVHIQ